MRHAILAALLSTFAAAAQATDVNGCQQATLTDLTAQASVQINFGGGLGQRYSPPCIKVSPGTTITFSGPFSTHPQAGGTYANGVDNIDPTSPIQYKDTGTSATYVMNRQGIFGYLCLQHYPIGMLGAIYVGNDVVLVDGFE